MSSGRKVIIYGGCGGLGSVLTKYFESRNWWTCCIDTKKSEHASCSVLVDKDQDWIQQEKFVLDSVRDHVGDHRIDAVINVAGGWAGGSADSADFIKNADLMWKQSVWSSGIAAVIGAKYLKENGCLVLPGAQPALGGTPGMIGYGMAKAAVHQLVKSLACSKSGLPNGVSCYGLLPATLDTPMNRKFMPKADFSTWTSLEYVAELLFQWSNREDRPSNGSLVRLVTKDGQTELAYE